MTSSKPKNNWDEVMEGVNEALSAKTADNKGTCGILIDPPTVENPIYTRISDNLDRVKNMLEGEKAEEYGNPRTMFRNISRRWFGCDDAEVDIAIMMAELKIERIKYDHGKFVLGATVEKISLPDNMMARFDGKSSLGRLGLCTHVTAGFIDAGFIGTITVELKNENNFPIMLKPGMRIGQVLFEYLNAASVKPYGVVGHYQHQNAPQPAVEVLP